MVLATCRSRATPRPALPCGPIPPFHTCNRQYPQRTTVNASVARIPTASTLTVSQPDRLLRHRFRRLLGVRSRSARMLAELPSAVLCRRRASADVRASIVRSNSYRLEQQFAEPHSHPLKNAGSAGKCSRRLSRSRGTFTVHCHAAFSGCVLFRLARSAGCARIRPLSIGSELRDDGLALRYSFTAIGPNRKRALQAVGHVRHTPRR